MKHKLFTLFALTLLSTSMILAQDSFVRSAQIDPPATFASGFGATVAGVDLDGDGKVEIYSVDGMSDFNTGDEIPQIIGYELNGGTWDSVWAVSFPDERQNTWAALTTGDLDGDGKKEIIWGYVNSFSTNTTPPRIVVFENSGDNSYGVSDGSGSFTPNTSWDMDVPASTNMRPLKWEAYDIDGDGTQEIIFAERRDYYNLGIISVSDVPDAGPGAEVWTMEFNKDSEMYNIFVHSATLDPAQIDYAGGVGDVLTGVDIDQDGLMDMYIVNDNTNDNPDNGELHPMLTKAELKNGAWVPRWTTDISNLIPLQNTWPILRYGDLDNDGKGEVIWLPVNNLGGDSIPQRIVVFEAWGDSSDGMGVDDGSGMYQPNAMWDMDIPANTDMRPLNAEVYDIDGDGQQEVCFAERKDFFGWGIVSVDNIPDNGDGSETWTMEAHGDGTKGDLNPRHYTESADLSIKGSNYRDMTIMNGKMYVHDWTGKIKRIEYTGGAYVETLMNENVPFWSFKSMSAVDIDNDGTEEMMLVNYSSPAKVYVLTEDGDSLAIHEIADLADIGISRAPGGNVGDIDGDGMVDFIAGARGADLIGRVEYQGGDITSSGSYTVSVLDQGNAPDGNAAHGNYEVIYLTNLDGDAADEVVFTSAYQRSLDVGVTYPLVVGDYSDTLTADAGRRWDMVVANGAAHFFNGSGDLQSVMFKDGQYVVSKTQPGVVNGAFLSASAYDMDDDGVEEIFVADWYDAKVKMLKYQFGYWTPFDIADFTDVGGNRMNGGSAGDIDGDGMVDFVCGSRQSVPNGQIYRVEYTGGDPTDMANWRADVIDQELDANFTQYEVVHLANLDDDPDQEVLYTSDYARGSATADDPQVPLVILDLQTVATTPIADVKVDNDGDFVPDNIGQDFTIAGVVTTPDFNASNSSGSFYVQDETAGINIYATTKPTTFPEVGALVQITGTLDQYNGLTEIKVTDADNQIVILGTGTVPEPFKLTIPEFFQDPEMYEGSLVKFEGVALMDGTWPDAGSNANITMWDGHNEFTMRIDKDVDIAGQPEPTWPVNMVGVVGQYDSNTPPNSGYQVFPRYYTDFEQNVQVPPSPYFALLTPEDNAVISMVDSNDTWTSTWEPAIDLNGDAVLYQWFADGINLVSGVLSDPSYVLTANDILGAMNGEDTLTFKWSVRASDGNAFSTSVDTFTVTFTNDIPVGIEDEPLPTKFYVDQNYPNPFNPATTIRFGLVKERAVDLRIYNLLGQEVAVLINNEAMSAGHHEVNFNASQLASGTYIYRLRADKKVVTKKMLLLK